MLIKIGTRASMLALWQAEMVATRLRENGAQVEIVKIETKGDKILNQPLSEIGSKGLFTFEIEEQLEQGQIDIAVHSAKDLQSVLPEGMEIIAYTERENPTDVLVSYKNSVSLDTQPLVVGTSSARRRAVLTHYYPQIQLVEMRGNLQTRFNKMQDGLCDAMVLAYAGVHRMQLDKYICQILPLDIFVPPVGQGCVAIEAHQSLDELKKELIIKSLNHHQTAICVRAERDLLGKLEGGCSIPLFCMANIHDNQLSMTAGVIDVPNKNRLIVSHKTSISDWTVCSSLVVYELEKMGVREILTTIKSKV